MSAWGLSAALLVALIGLRVVIDTVRLGAPPMPSTFAARSAVISMLPTAPTGTVHDIGSGWGGLARAVAHARPDLKVVAHEAAWAPAAWSRLVFAAERLPNLQLRPGDARTHDLSNASVLVCYLSPELMVTLAPMLNAALDRGVEIVSIAFALPGATPRQTLRLADLYHTPVYRYSVG